MLIISPSALVVTFAVAFVVGAPPPAPPVANVTTSPLAYLLLEPAPAFLISTVSTKPTPVLPPAVLDSCPANTQSKNATLGVLLSDIKSDLKNANLGNSSAQAARAMSQLARVYGGTQFQNDFGNIKIVSAYRSKALNQVLPNNPSNSEHIYGYAVDIRDGSGGNNHG